MTLIFGRVFRNFNRLLVLPVLVSLQCIYDAFYSSRNRPIHVLSNYIDVSGMCKYGQPFCRSGHEGSSDIILMADMCYTLCMCVCV